MRGRPPKPSRLKAITGNPGKHPLNQQEPIPEPAIPPCPPELGPAARNEWHRLAGELAKLHLLTHLDLSYPTIAPPEQDRPIHKGRSKTGRPGQRQTLEHFEFHSCGP